MNYDLKQTRGGLDSGGSKDCPPTSPAEIQGLWWRVQVVCKFLFLLSSNLLSALADKRRDIRDMKL